LLATDRADEVEGLIIESLWRAVNCIVTELGFGLLPLFVEPLFPPLLPAADAGLNGDPSCTEMASFRPSSQSEVGCCSERNIASPSDSSNIKLRVDLALVVNGRFELLIVVVFLRELVEGVRVFLPLGGVIETVTGVVGMEGVVALGRTTLFVLFAGVGADGVVGENGAVVAVLRVLGF
jgi:hypothetical protein